MYSLACGISATPNGRIDHDTIPLSGWKLNRFGPQDTLPLRPLWPGFAINTIFYAAILWLLFVAPFALRRSQRIKRGLCPKCAYDLRGGNHSACPECGVRSADSREPTAESLHS